MHHFFSRYWRILVALFVFGVHLPAIAQQAYTLSGRVQHVVQGQRQPLAQASVEIIHTGAAQATNSQGQFEFPGLSAGSLQLRIHYLGKVSIDTTFILNGPTQLEFTLQDNSYRMEEVQVTALQSDRSAGTSSLIGRQAIEHLQANSLADIMSLLPGGLTSNPDLTNAKQINIRHIANDITNANAFGTSIVMNGAPVSNNANLQTMNPTVSGIGASLAGGAAPSGGIDVRNIPVQNIESVEVIRGIPSVEFGDVSSGAVIVQQKAGRQQLLVEGRTNPNLYALTATQGFSLGENAGALNVGADYSYNVSDPIQAYLYYQRATLNTLYSNQWLNGRLSTNTALALSLAKNTRKLNPDDEITKEKSRGDESGITLNTNGNLRIENRWLQSFKYVGNINYAHKSSMFQKQYTSANAPYSMSYTDGAVLSNFPGRSFYDTEGNEITRIPSQEEDLYAVYLPSTYVGEYAIDGKEFGGYAKGVWTFFNQIGNTQHRWLVGADYKIDKNFGRGKTFADSLPPYRSVYFDNATFRKRAYRDIPALQQFGVFLEENLQTHIGRNALQIAAGLRYDVFSGKRTALSPRINVDLEIIPGRWNIRGGYGLLAKAPSLSYLYPENAYFEYININELATTSIPEDQRVFMTTTRVFDTENASLKIAKNQKAELGFDFHLPNFGAIRLTGFQEKLRDGYTFGITRHSFQPLAYLEYKRVDADQPIYQMTSNPVLAKFNRPGNHLQIEKKGIELEMHLKRIDAIRTQFSLTGMHIQQRQSSNEYSFYDEQSGASGANRTHIGLYEPEMMVVHQRSTVTSLRATHNIPKIGLVLTLTTEVNWNEADWTVYGNDSIPVKYISKHDGKLYDFDLSKKEEAEFASLLRPVSRTDEIVESFPTYLNFNLNITKEIKDFMRVSFFANNVFRSYPYSQSDRVKSQYYDRNIPFFFGLNVALKL